MDLDHAAAALVALALAVSPVAAQSAGAAREPTLTPRALYEWQIDRYEYRFENPSKFDTDFLVPHHFIQSYDGAAHWLGGALAYRALGDRMETHAAVALPSTMPGSDFDTFFNPGGDVIVYGTDGRVELLSLRVGHSVEGRIAGATMRMGYVYRRDRANFLPTDRIITHSNPVSLERSSTFGRETTISDVHRLPVALTVPAGRIRTRALYIDAEVVPLLWARLTTRLPDKYPDQDIVFEGKGSEVAAALRLAPPAGRRWPLAASVRYSRTFSYDTARQFRQRALQIQMSVGGRTED